MRPVDCASRSVRGKRASWTSPKPCLAARSSTSRRLRIVSLTAGPLEASPLAGGGQTRTAVVVVPVALRPRVGDPEHDEDADGDAHPDDVAGMPSAEHDEE